MDELSGSPQSYLDFAGLGNLRGQAKQKTDTATRQTATQFEAMFIQMMLKSMREATEKSDLMSSDVGEQFEQMYDKELSVQLAKRNTLGVADMLVKHIDLANAATEAANAPGGGRATKNEGMLLNPPAVVRPLPQEQDGVPLVRPDKFSIKPIRANPLVSTATPNGADQ